MKRKITTRIRRIMSLCLALAIMLASTTVYAASTYANPVDRTNEVKTVSYDMETGETTYVADQNYTLENANSGELEGINTEGISPTAIIGPDDRIMVSDTTAYPYNAVCYVESTFPDGTIRRGSGSLVYSTVMLTSGDMVYSHDHGGWATKIMVIPGLNSDGQNRPYGTAYGTKVTTNEEWTQNKATDWDWGIVDLDRGFNSWLRAGYNDNYTLYIGFKASTVGYPRDKGFQMWQDTNSISGASERFLKILCDIEYGDNGAPVMALDTGQVVGIIVTAHKENDVYFYNGAVRINSDLYSRIQAHIQEVQQ